MLLPDEMAPPASKAWKRLTKLCAAAGLLSILLVATLLAINGYLPSPALVLLIQIAAIVSLASASAALLSGVRYLLHSRPTLLRPILFLVVVTLAVFAAHLYVINSPPDSTCASSAKQGCVMDESYYVPSAKGILTGEQCAPYADNCNLEHPFLVKAMIAAGMAVFGVNEFGWRIFNVVLGTLCIPLLFLLVLHVSGNRKWAYFSCLLMASDTLFFVHSSIAVLDIPQVFFALLAFIFYFWRGSFWKIDNLVASGIFLGLALLSKETAIFIVAGLVTYHLYASRASFRKTIVGGLKILVPAAAVFIIGLQIYAGIYTSTQVPTFVQEIQFIFKYGSGLTGTSGMWCCDAFGGTIQPYDWFVYYNPIGYLMTTVTITSGNSVTHYVGGFWGVTNPIVVWLVFAWVPIIMMRALRRKPEDSVQSPDDRLGVFLLFWLLWGYIPYLLLEFYGRATYPFYAIPVVPALAVGSAYFITRDWFPSKVALLYLVAAFGWFFLYFPNKDFLPVWIRVILNR